MKNKQILKKLYILEIKKWKRLILLKGLLVGLREFNTIIRALGDKKFTDYNQNTLGKI